MLRGLHHGALNVSDWDGAMAFFRDTLGFEFIAEGDASGHDFETNVDLPGAAIRWAVLKVGNGFFELIQYSNPKPRANDRAVCDTGNAHIAFTVDDCEKEYERLKARGVRFTGKPIHINEGKLAGNVFVCFHGPDGILLEINEDHYAG